MSNSTTAINLTMGRLGWALVVLLALLWGGTFFFVEVALAALPPPTVVLCRVGVAAMALFAVVCATGHRLPTDMRRWGAFLVMGAINNLLPFSLITWGQTQITSGLASILNATTPLFAVVLAHLLTSDERMTPYRLGGVLAGLAGTVVMIGPGALAGLGLETLAELAVLGAALCYALAGIFGRRFADTPPLVTATGQLLASTALALPIALAVDRPWTLPLPDATAIAALAALALMGTAAAYVVYFRILASAGATNLLLVTFLMPVIAVLLGAVVLGEAVEPGHFAGMAMIGLGLAAIDGRLLRLLRHRIGGRRGAAIAGSASKVQDMRMETRDD